MLYKDKFDASWTSPETTSSDLIFRNHFRSILHISLFPLQSRSPIVAEALAFLEGLKLASTMGVNHAIMKGDCLSLTNAKNRSWKIPWEINNIVRHRQTQE